MPIVELNIPPGLYRNGTPHQAKARWFEANLVRWEHGNMAPMGGWERLSTSQIATPIRQMLAWNDSSSQSWVALGTNQDIHVMERAGDVHNITPDGFIPGTISSFNPIAYGEGLYGANLYGSRIFSTLLNPVGTWSFDLWGENLIGIMNYDATLYDWVPNTSNKMQPVANAPNATGVLVTDQRIVVLWGADGDPRKIRWSDQEDNTQWTALPTNQAGDFTLQTKGIIVTGIKTSDGALLFTDNDVHRMSYIGTPYVFSVERIGADTGIISANAAVQVQDQVYWIGNRSFFMYNGYVREIGSEIADYVFENLNEEQATKISGFHNSLYNEIWWLVPFDAETDRYVIYNYAENHWNVGKIDRASGVDVSPYRKPLMAGHDGYIYQHETAFDYPGSDLPWVQSGPFELGEGERIAHLYRYIPDDTMQGGAQISLKSGDFPKSDEVLWGPHPISTNTGLRVGGRKFSMRIDALSGEHWRFGQPRVEVKQGGKRLRA